MTTVESIRVREAINAKIRENAAMAESKRKATKPSVHAGNIHNYADHVVFTKGMGWDASVPQLVGRNVPIGYGWKSDVSGKHCWCVFQQYDPSGDGCGFEDTDVEAKAELVRYIRDLNG